MSELSEAELSRAELTGAELKRAVIAASAYFLALFAVGFVLGTVRVLVAEPRLGRLVATLIELPVMLTIAYFACRWAIRRWHVVRHPIARWGMVLWFMILLLSFETVLGMVLFGRTVADQLAAMTAPAGLLGLSAQVIAALLPVFVGMSKSR